MKHRYFLDRLLAPLTLAFSVLCASALLVDIWTQPQTLTAPSA